MTATIVEFELSIDINFEQAVACHNSECDVEASWNHITSCCSQSVLYCDEHSARMIDIGKKFPTMSMRHTPCNQSVLAPKMYHRIFPI